MKRLAIAGIGLAAREKVAEVYESLMRETPQSRSIAYGYQLGIELANEYNRAHRVGDRRREQMALEKFQMAVDTSAEKGYIPNFVYEGTLEAQQLSLRRFNL